MNDLISIIIPVYNVEKYLEKCVKSTINQTYENIEIILVDDGSTDGCPKLCDDIKKQDKRIRVFHKENGGLSDARNYGIKKAKGKYLIFVDSDDWIDSNYVKYLYNLIIENSCEVAVCEIAKVTVDGKIVSSNMNNDFILKMNQKEALKNMIEVKYFATSACGKMYKKECFDKIEFPVGRLFEDIPTNYNIFLSINNVVFGARALYFYLTREGSITRKKFSLKNLDSIYFIEDSMSKVLKKYPDFDTISKIRIFLAYFDIWKILDNENIKTDYYKKINTVIRELRISMILKKETRLIVKIKAILTFLPRSFVNFSFHLMGK